jgi:hypothetical protein
VQTRRCVTHEALPAYLQLKSLVDVRVVEHASSQLVLPVWCGLVSTKDELEHWHSLLPAELHNNTLLQDETKRVLSHDAGRSSHHPQCAPGCS